MSDDTPTQRFDAPAPGGTGPVEVPASRRRSPLVPILGIIGAVLLVAVVVLGILLFTRGSGTPAAADTTGPTDSAPSTPVPTPTVTVTVTAAPPQSPAHPVQPAKPNGNNVLITGYSISPTVIDCSPTAPADAANLTIKWTSLNGNVGYFGVNTVDAQAGGMGWSLPSSGSQNDFPAGYHPFTYPCGAAQEQYTLTIVGNGSKQSLSIVVKRK